MDVTEQLSKPADEPTGHETRDRLMSDLKNVLREAETFVKSAGPQTTESLNNARAKVQETLNSAKNELMRMEESVVVRTKKAAKATDLYVTDHPWQSVGMGACVGLLCGLLIGQATRK